MGIDQLPSAAAIKLRLGPIGGGMRQGVRDYVRTCDKNGFAVSAALAVLAEHLELTRLETAHQDGTHRAHVILLTTDDVRLTVFVTGAAHLLGGWTPQEVAAEMVADGQHIVGSVLSRAMIVQPYGGTDATIMERLVASLDTDERMYLVCQGAAMLGTLGFTPEEVMSMTDETTDQGDQAEETEAAETDQGDQAETDQGDQADQTATEGE